MKNATRYCCRLVGIGVGAAIGGPLVGALGNSLGDLVHDVVGDFFGSGDDVGKDISGLLGNVAASAFPSLLPAPTDYPHFNHDFRRGLLGALATALESEVPRLYADEVVAGTDLRKTISHCHLLLATHLRDGQKQALKKNDHDLFQSLFPTDLPDRQLLQLQDENDDGSTTAHLLLSQWYDQVLAPIVSVKCKPDLPALGGADTFRTRTLAALVIAYPAAFAHELKKKENDRLRIATQRLLLNDLRRQVRVQGPAAQISDELLTRWDKKLELLSDGLTAQLEKIIGKLDDIKSDTAQILQEQAFFREQLRKAEEREQQLQQQLTAAQRREQEQFQQLRELTQIVLSQQLIKPQLAIGPAIQAAISSGTLLTSIPPGQEQEHLHTLVAWVEASPASTTLDRGMAAHLAGRHEEAAEHASDAYFQEKQKPEPNPVVLQQAAVLEAVALNLTEQYLEAAQALVEAAAQLDPQKQPLTRASMLHRAGNLFRNAGHYPEAESALREALLIFTECLGLNTDYSIMAGNDLGLVLLDEARFQEAEPFFHWAAIYADSSPSVSPHTFANYLNNLALVYGATNRHAEAEPLFRRALQVVETAYGTNHHEVAHKLNNLAHLLQATNRSAEAEPMFRRALAIDEASFGKEHPNVASRLNNLAHLLQATNRSAEAEPMFRRALAIDEASFGPDHPEVALKLSNLAHLLQATNHLAEAEPLVRRAVEILVAFGQRTGHEHPLYQTAVGNFRSILQAQGLTEEAIRERLQEIKDEVVAS